MKFPGLATGTFASLSTNQITNLSLHMYESSGNNASAYIDVYQYTGAAWNETTAKCNNITWNPSGSEFTWNYFNCTGWQTFNMTSMVATWKSGGSGVGSPLDKGIMLKNYMSETNAIYSKHFRSAEYGGTSTAYKPYLSFSYTPPAPTSVSISPFTKIPGNTLFVHTSHSLSAIVLPSLASQTVAWSSSNTNIATINAFTGLICTNSGGTTEIKATASNGVYTSFILKVSGERWAQRLTNSNANINSGFNRSNARTYMETWYDSFNPAYKKEDNDCANYTSQCLLAGGFGFVGAPTNNTEATAFEASEERWYYCPQYEHWASYIPPNKVNGISYSWTSVEKFRKFWGKRTNGTISNCYQYFEYASVGDCFIDLAYLATVLHPGDILQFTGPHNHNMIVSGVVTTPGSEDILYSGHTGPRLDASFKANVLQNNEYSGCQIVIMRISRN